MNCTILNKTILAAAVSLAWSTAPALMAANESPLLPFANETITVTTLEDVTDFTGAQRVGDLPGPDGVVSFREAVTAANNTTGPQTIAFAISPSEFWLVEGVGLLRLEEGPFSLTDSGTTIDFSTQTTNIGDTNPSGPEIGIYGLEPNGLGSAAIFLDGNNCVIKGLGSVYQRGYAVQITGNNNRIIGCQIDGPVHAAVSISGFIGGPTPMGNTVGGTSPGEGNTLIGLNIDGPAENNIVIGNPLLVGVQVRGATQYGVFARNNRIGGTTAAERNVISGNGRFSEEGFPDGAQVSIVDTDGTVVEGNYIGTTADGMARYPQQIGPVGVDVRDARGTTIRGNLIAGLRTVGTNHYAGQVFGVAVNVGAINANIQDTRIEGNTIGLAADGVTSIVTRSGIIVAPFTSSRHAFNTLVTSNHIATVETAGVSVAPLESGVTITANSIHDNGGLGINLNSGGNHQQAFPVLQSATTTGSSFTAQGTLDSVPSSQFTIEFFKSPTCDPSGFGEGATFIGSTPVTTDGNGHAVFSVTLPGSAAVGTTATATATRVSTADTSQFSACMTVAPGGAATPTPTPTATAVPTATPAPTPTPSATPIVTPTPTPIVTPSATPSATASPTPIGSPTATPSATPGSIPSKAINLSTRLQVQAGDHAGIGGFIITGNTPKRVLIRAIGPSLTGFGIPDVLGDPVLELHGPAGFITMNDNWRDTQESAIQATGIAPTDTLESAIDATLTPGAYTAIVRGNGNTSGVALVEVYDLNQTADSKMANISTRSLVGAGDNMVIAGFVLSEPQQAGGLERVIVRGIGPSLTGLGIADALANPTLELRDSNGTLLVSNNDWQDNPVQAAELTDAGLAPSNPLESGIAAALPPGPFTALLSGIGNSTGIGIVEVYDRGTQ
jgi:hypothetical protein